MPDLLLQPVPHREAADFIRAKPPVARAVFDQLVPELQARAFAVTGIESANVLQNLRDKIATLPEGADWDAVKGSVALQVSPWLKHAEGAELEDIIRAGERRAETLLRWHGFQAYSAAQYEVMARQADVFPFWRYESSEDAKVRPSHAALDGKILPVEDPFWQTHFPPWEYGCRCRVVPLTQDDVDEVLAREADLPPEAKSVVPEDIRREMNAAGVLRTTVGRSGGGTVGQRAGVPAQIDVRTPAQRGRPGPQWRPGDLRLPAEQIRQRYDPDTWRVFEQWGNQQRLPDGRTVMDWMHGRAATVAKAVALNAATAAASRSAIESATFSKETSLGGGVNETVILETDAGEKVVFKPAAGERAGLRPGVAAGTQYQREAAASALDEILGTDLVPATTIITHQGRIGSAQLFQAGFETPMRLARQGGLPPPAKLRMQFTKRQRQDWQLFDELVAHTDRHPGNFMLRKRAAAGAKGEPAWDVALIDNGLCLSTTGYEYLRAAPASGLKLDKVSLARLDRFLAAEAEVRTRLGALGIEAPALDALFARAHRLRASGRFSKVYREFGI